MTSQLATHFAVLAFAMFASVFTVPVQAEPERKPIVVTPAQEVAWGEKERESFLKEHRQTADANLAIHVDEIGRRIAKFTDRLELVYHFLVIEGEDLQAYSFPGGTVCLTEALAKLFGSDDELAFALGHEIAHSVLRHHVAKLRIEDARRDVPQAQTLMLKAMGGRIERAHELEADRYGALYVVRAGYRFSAASQAIERLAKRSRGPMEDEAHPDFESRLTFLRTFGTELKRAIEAFQKGTDALKAGKAEEAISALEIFVAQFPQSLPGRVNLGAAYLAKVRSTAGTPMGLAEVLPILPEPGFVIRGTYSQIDLERARSSFEQALQVRPGDFMAQAGLALIYMRFGNYPDARRYLNEALKTEPDNAEALLSLGNVEFLAGNHEGAVSYYMKALSPPRADWPEARMNLALACQQLGRDKQAKELWEGLTSDTRLGAEAKQRLAALEGNR